MHENNFVSGNGESPVARRNRTAWHNLSDERQRRRDEEDDALDDGRSWPGGRSALGETNGRGRAPTRASAKRQGGHGGPPSAPRLRQLTGLARAGAGTAA